MLSATTIAKLVVDNARSHAAFLEGENGYGVSADRVNPDEIAACKTVAAWPVNDRKVAVTMSIWWLPRYARLLTRFIDEACPNDMPDSARIDQRRYGARLTW